MSKSLFFSPVDCGLPIGNLSSQVFANFYMHNFDHFVKHDLAIKCYGRYVDDFYLIHKDKNRLQLNIHAMSRFLKEHLKLTLHPKKLYLQHYSKGLKFIGAVIKPGRIYISNRTKGNFYATIRKHNLAIEQGLPSEEELNSFISSMNSYLGIMKHYSTYKIRKRLALTGLHPDWWKYVYLDGKILRFGRRNLK